MENKEQETRDISREHYKYCECPKCKPQKDPQS